MLIKLSSSHPLITTIPYSTLLHREDDILAIQSFDFGTGKAIDTSKRKVITSEYDLDDLALLSKICRSMKFQVAGKANDERALLELARKHKVGVVFLDTDSNGFDAIELLKKLKEKHPAFLVVLTGETADQETVKQALSSGADGFAVKPFQADSIKKILEKID